MKDKEFRETVFGIVFGDSAKCVPEETGKPNEFTKREVIEKLLLREEIIRRYNTRGEK